MKKITTATEMAIIRQVKYASMMNWKMAKALVEGKVSSQVLRWAEEVYSTQKDIFEDSLAEIKKEEERK